MHDELRSDNISKSAIFLNCNMYFAMIKSFGEKEATKRFATCELQLTKHGTRAGKECPPIFILI